MKLRVLFILLSIVVWCTCSDDKPTSYIGEPYTVNYVEDANKMALYYSGELHPPEHLVRQFDEELTLIRQTWGDSIPIVNCRFMLPWSVGYLYMRFDDTAFATLENGVNPAWEELNDKLGVRYSILFGGSDGLIPNWVGVYSREYMNPLKLGEYYIEFPGINLIETSVMPLPYAKLFVRSQTNNEVNYYFKDYCLDEVYFTYYYFKVLSDRVILMGRHEECMENYDSLWQVLPWDSFYILERYCMDSIEANKPAWVDTARACLRDLDNNSQFSWSRGY
ncbi:MAG: hypothetical protein ACOYVF_00670 [Candidatus Zixiibacteriota bacterium]